MSKHLKRWTSFKHLYWFTAVLYIEATFVFQTTLLVQSLNGRQQPLVGLAVIQNLPKTSKHHLTKDNSPAAILDLNKLGEHAQKWCTYPPPPK